MFTRREVLRQFALLPVTSGALTCLSYAQEERYRLFREKPRVGTGILTARFYAPSKWTPKAYFYIPVMPSFFGQEALSTEIKLTNSTALQQKYVDKLSEQEFVRLNCENSNTQFDSGFTIQVKYRAKIYDTGLEIGQPTTLPTNETSRFVGVSECMDYNEPEFRSFLRETDLIRRANEDSLHFVYRVFKVISQRFNGDNFPKDRNASRICRYRGLECNTSSTLLSSVCRANNIPARLLNGRNTRSDPHPLGTSHFRAQVFIDNMGWLTTEGFNHGVPEEELQNSFGMIPKSLIVVAIGSDFQLETHNGSMQTFQTSNSIQKIWSLGTAEHNFSWDKIRGEQQWVFEWE